jgi:quercetin dioxygenase-like cupin family protein
VSTGAVAAVGGDPASAGAPAADGFPFGADRSRRVGPVVPPEGREALTLESGVTWEMLGQIPGIPVEFLRVIYPPGSASSIGEHLMRHVGAEYGFLVSGELVLTLGFEEHRIRAGDAYSFPSTTPHRYRNDTDEPAVGIWFVLEDI